MVHGEKNAAKSCLQSKNLKISERHKSLTLVSRKGERKFSSGWGWQSAEWNNMWVLGLTWDKGGGNYLIEIAHNPANELDISLPALRHEFGHFWLMSNFGNDSHDPKYKDCFWNWNEPNIRSMTLTRGGESVIVHFVFE